MKRSLSRLLSFPLFPADRESLITLYARGANWKIELVRIADTVDREERYLPASDLEVDWEAGFCRRRGNPAASPSTDSPAALIDLTQVLGRPLLAEGTGVGTVVEGILEENELRLSSLILADTQLAGHDPAIISTEWISWVAGEKPHSIVRLPLDRVVSILESSTLRL